MPPHARTCSRQGMIHPWLAEVRWPGQQRSWYLQSCRFHMQHYLDSGRSIDSLKRGAPIFFRLALPHFYRGAKPAWTLAAVRVSSVFRLVAVYACVLATGVYAAVTLTPATGGAKIVADKAAHATSPGLAAL